MPNELKLLTDSNRFALRQVDLWNKRKEQAQTAVAYWKERADTYSRSIGCLSTATPLEMMAADPETQLNPTDM